MLILTYKPEKSSVRDHQDESCTIIITQYVSIAYDQMVLYPNWQFCMSHPSWYSIVLLTLFKVTTQINQGLGRGKLGGKGRMAGRREVEHFSNFIL